MVQGFKALHNVQVVITTVTLFYTFIKSKKTFCYRRVSLAVDSHFVLVRMRSSSKKCALFVYDLFVSMGVAVAAHKFVFMLYKI